MIKDKGSMVIVGGCPARILKKISFYNKVIKNLTIIVPIKNHKKNCKGNTFPNRVWP